MNNRRKLIRILLILVITYAVCWYPLYLINTVDLYFPQYHSTVGMTLFTVVLSHFGCAVNPVIYAYGVPGFQQALRKFFRIGDSRIGAPCRATSTIGHCSCLMKTRVSGKESRKIIRTVSNGAPHQKRSHVHFADPKRKISEPPSFNTSNTELIFSPIRIVRNGYGFETREYFC